MLVRLNHVSTGYGSHLVLKGIDLEIAQGDFIGVIGPNGGGKTTLLRLILGSLQPWAGNLERAPELKTRGGYRIGYLPQDPGLDPRFPVTAEDVVRTGLVRGNGLSSWRRGGARALAALERTGMREARGASFGELSGGQRQKVLLARAIADQPLLLVLDEPDTFTDQRFEKDLYTLLQELNQQMAILMVSHDLGMISSHVKTIACVNEGLHYHRSNIISREMMEAYECPIDIITHGHLPHRVLDTH
ncbi:MAG TPA: ABC transporter ATP-binding protein [Bacteroidales bacterium]|nr:ABC transporter ATP-binding protein [Bacteroidales bacterium]HRZ77923.1 ABC transporter ATP-binding protein [Bacteroidales bacterium]